MIPGNHGTGAYHLLPGHGATSSLSRCLLVAILLLCIVVPLAADQGSDLTAQGTALMGQGRYTEAVAAFNAALGQNPANVEARVGKGTALFSAGQSSEALLSLDIATSQDPSYLPAWLERGKVLLATGNPGEAGQSYDQALRVSPASATALEGKGDATGSIGPARGSPGFMEGSTGLRSR